jgi:Zn-dependent protease with chaperone function
MTPPRIYVVQSDYINAFAVILAFPPYTLFTSHLTNLFNSKEVFAVLLHETGHHSNKNSISFLVTISLLIFYLMLIPILILLLVISIAVKQYITLLWTLAVLLLSRIIFAWLITTLLRKGEKDADLYASKTLGKNRIWLINSLRKLEIAQKKKLKKISLLRLARRLLCLVYFDPFQTHPPIPERIKYIKDCP